MPDSLQRRPGPLRIALVAMAGMVLLLVSGEISGAKAGSSSTRACCPPPMMADGCRCCVLPTEPNAASPASRDVVMIAVEMLATSPAAPCVCRPSGPSPRESRPESRMPEPRPLEGQAGTLSPALLPLDPPHLLNRSQALSRGTASDSIPLFLRVERLRF